jgi:phosphoserine phosphatase RsbU/P
MGMVKSSARMALLKGGPIAELLGDLNRVVYEVKTTPSTYVVFSCLRCGAGGRVEYAIAGSGPMLHYQARSRSARQLGMDQFPLGMFPKAGFESGVVALEPGDVLAVMTDGIPETANANDEQFGLERIGEILAAGQGKGLAELTDAVFAAVRGHGPQTDDETLVLIRASV